MAETVEHGTVKLPKCLCHIKTGNKEKTRPFTETSWKSFKNAVTVREDPISIKYPIILGDKPVGSYHPNCYKQYTNSGHLRKLQNRRRSPRKRAGPAINEESECVTPKKRTRRSVSTPIAPKQNKCFVCKNEVKYKKDKKNKEPLLTCEDENVAIRIKEAAIVRKHKRLLLDIGEKDPATITTLELKYHKPCYAAFINNRQLDLLRKNMSSASSSGAGSSNPKVEAFNMVAEIIDEKVIKGKDTVCLSLLRDKYLSTLSEKGVEEPICKISTLKKKIIDEYNDSVAFERFLSSQPEYVYNSISDPKEIEDKLNKSSDSEMEMDAFPLGDENPVYHCGIIINSIIKSMEDTMPWPPPPEYICKENVEIPDILYNLLAYIITGTPSPVAEGRMPVNSDTERQIFSVAQDLINIVSKGKVKTVKSLGLGVAVRNLTGNKEVNYILNRFGHALSYNVIQRYEKARVAQLHGDDRKSLVLPPTVKARVPTSFVWDNNDLSEETLTGAGTTHVTNGIIIQQGDSDTQLIFPVDRGYEPPDTMTNIILPHNLHNRIGPSPIQADLQSVMRKHAPEKLELASRKDFLWLLLRQQPTADLFTIDTRAAQTIPGWSPFNAMLKEDIPTKNVIGYLQPVNESPTEISAVYTLLKRSQHFAYKLELNEVDCVFDQAVYAKACEVIWASPLEFSDVLCRLGQFHSIPVFIKCIFKRYGDAGLNDIITESDIVAGGSLNGVMTGSHYNRAVRTLKIMYEAFSRLQLESFKEYMTTVEDLDVDLALIADKILEMREDFSAETCSEFLESQTMRKLYEHYSKFKESNRGPMFKFWNGFLEMIQLLLSFIRSCREGDLLLNLDCFREMLDYYDAYDMQNYLRYGAFYYCTMRRVKETHPQIYQQMMNGQFAVQLSDRNSFGKIPEDQTIEETINKHSKIPGGIVGKSRNISAVEQWIETTADRSQITENIKNMVGLGPERTWTHKEGSKTRVKTDEKDVRSVIEVVRSMLNPYDLSEELTSISTGIKASDDTMSDLLNAKDIGSKHIEEFIKDRILSNETEFFEPVKKHKLNTFTNQTSEKKVKVGSHEIIVKADRSFFCKLVAIARSRDLDLFDVYSHELGPIPWAIATPHGTLYQSDKAKLIEELEKDIPSVPPPANASWIIDLFAAIQVLKPAHLPHLRESKDKKWKPNNFADVAESIIASVCKPGITQPRRVDVVVDQYPDKSIKAMERERRTPSLGRKTKVSSGTQKAPNDWKNFLSHPSNKQELPDFLVRHWTKESEKVSAALGQTTMFVCNGTQCSRFQVRNDTLDVCDIPGLTTKAEEADGRIFLHAKHIAEHGHAEHIVIKSPDTDVLVLAIYFQSQITIPLLINRQGSRRQWKYTSVKAICTKLGPEKSKALLGFHAFSGCDSTSFFSGKGKKTFFKLLDTDHEFCSAMQRLGSKLKISSKLYDDCEAAICRLYGRQGPQVNQVRYDMLTKGAESHEIPPTQDALRLHTERANYQAFIWKNSLDPSFKPPDADGHGWVEKDGRISIKWMTQDPAPKSVLEFAHCKTCKKCNTRRCACKNRTFKCTDACGCDVNLCENSEDSGEMRMRRMRRTSKYIFHL